MHGSAHVTATWGEVVVEEVLQQDLLVVQQSVTTRAKNWAGRALERLDLFPWQQPVADSHGHQLWVADLYAKQVLA